MAEAYAFGGAQFEFKNLRPTTLQVADDAARVPLRHGARYAQVALRCIPTLFQYRNVTVSPVPRTQP
jgi:hypothetical protein